MRVAADTETRLFHVRRTDKPKKADPWEKVYAQECILTDNGCLLFRENGSMVLLLAAGTWGDLEEGDPED